jgi:hypothetical protein
VCKRLSLSVLIALVVPVVLGACATPAYAPEEMPAAYGLSVGAEVPMARSRDDAARCLRVRENSASYPWGVAPGFTSTEVKGDNAYVTQWFSLKRGMQWSTHFVLRPVGDGSTLIQVVLPMELSLSESYLRAALEVIGHCQPA